MQKSNVKKNRSTGFGIAVLLIFAVVIYLIFKILTPNNFGTLANLSSYAQQCIIQATAACGFYFIMVMGLFDFSLGSNIVLSAIVGSIRASAAGYPGLILGGGMLRRSGGIYQRDYLYQVENPIHYRNGRYDAAV